MYYPYVSFVAPYCIFLPDGEYEVRYNGEQTQVRLTFLPVMGPAPSGMEYHGKNIELHHDIFGHVGNTKFEILFVDRIVEQSHLPVPEDMELIEEGINVANRVLEVYRAYDHNSNGLPSFHIIYLSRHDLSLKSAALADENFDIKKNSIASEPLQDVISFGPDNVWRKGVVLKRIKTILTSGQEVPLDLTLLRSAENRLWRREYHLIPVEMNTLFEVTAVTMLKKAGGADVTVPTAFFGVLTSLQKYANVVRETSGLDPINWIDPNKGWKDLHACTEIVDWRKHCYQLRCQVVHEGKLTVTRDEAEMAISKACAAAYFIEHLIPGNPDGLVITRLVET